MKRFWIFVVALTVATCGAEKTEAEDNDGEKGEAVEQEEQEAPTMDYLLGELDALGRRPESDRKAVDRILEHTETVLDLYPDHERTSQVLLVSAIKANSYADISTTGQDNPSPDHLAYYRKALNLLEIVIANTAKEDDKKMAMEIKATILDISLEENDQAIVAYQELISSYPSDSARIEEWQYRIDHIDENPLDLILGS